MVREETLHKETRRLVAIMSADIVGYSRLMGAHEDRTVAAMRDLRADVIDPLLERHGGRVANTAGDSLLIVFDSATEAVQCALALQRGVAEHGAARPAEERIAYRVGVNLGDVIAHGDDVLGDGVNIASRLEGLAPSGGIVVSRAVVEQVGNRAGAAFADMGEIDVKNIARPVHAFRVVPGETDGLTGLPSAGVRSAFGFRARKVSVVGAVMLLLLAAVAGWWFAKRPMTTPGTYEVKSGLKAPPAIAVLPFRNLSGDPADDYFVDGFSEDITTDLSRVDGLKVASLGASRNFAEKRNDLAGISGSLGVGHVLDGSVRRADGRLRINVTLVETSGGQQVWAARYDRDTDDLFAVQDDIAARTVMALGEALGLPALSAPKREYVPDIAAYDQYVQGRAQRIPPTPENLAAARASFEKAMEIDPGFAGGYAGAAYVDILKYGDAISPPDDPAGLLARAEQLAEKAVDLGPDFGPAWGSLAEARLRTHRFDDALVAARHAVDKAPADALMRAFLGRVLGFAGRADEGIEEVRTALRMSPDSLPMLYLLGTNLRLAGRFDGAVEALAEHRRRLAGRILPGPTGQYIAALIQAGQRDRAASEAAALLKTAPQFTATLALREQPYARDADTRALVDALRAAGIPE